MASDAQSFAATSVTGRAGRRIEARLASVLAAARADPTGRMRAPECSRLTAYALLRMAVSTQLRVAMARGAEPRIRARLLHVSLAEPRTVEIRRPRDLRLVERESPRERGDGHAVARRALGLGVAGRAEIACARRADAVLAYEVTLVHDVARRSRELARQAHVARVAVTHRPLIFVRVAREALGHRRTHGGLVRLPCSRMAGNALSAERREMSLVGESQVVARQLNRLTGVRRAVATTARPRVVGLRMTAHAFLRVGDVERTFVSRARHSAVAVDARDAGDAMRAVLERMLRVARLDAEKARARGEQRREDEHHQPRERRASHRAAFGSNT